MATITIPTALRQYAGGKASLSIEAETVGGLLRGLVEQHPALGKHLFSEQGKLRSFVNIYLGDEDIRYLEGEETPVAAGDTVSIIPAIAGGAVVQNAKCKIEHFAFCIVRFALRRCVCLRQPSRTKRSPATRDT